MCKVLIFAGTTEGRELAEYLDSHQVNTYVCTATEYGESLISKTNYLAASGKRLNQEEILQLLQEKKPQFVIDATHPYATVVSRLVKEACKEKGFRYVRLLREALRDEKQQADMVYVNSVSAAVEHLMTTTGKIFVTTGSKELKEYTRLTDYKERVLARVLSSKEAMDQVVGIGFEGKNLICMQGPFSEDINYFMLKESGCKYLVTKEAGKNGGYLEKINAAKRLGITCIVIGRPQEEEGGSYEEVLTLLQKEYSIKDDKKEFMLIGIGMGNENGMTLEATKAIAKADVIFGAKRMLAVVGQAKATLVEQYKKEEIAAYLKEHKAYKKIGVLVSGDVGFFSAAKDFHAYFKEDNVEYLVGTSSLSYFCAKLGKPWDDVTFISNHGMQRNTIDLIRRNPKLFSLMGGENSVSLLMKELIAYGFEDINVYVGENLGYDTEKITNATPRQLVEKTFHSLCVVYMENEDAKEDEDRILDEEFIRGDVPMTKEEVRTVSIAKLSLCKDSILYDIGAGTGSVSIQAAKRAYEGMVYAIEKKAEGVALIHENKKKFKVSNIKVIEGSAPEALIDLPTPTHAFIGGSSGTLGQMIRLLKEKNPAIKIVVNAITLETISEAVATIKELGLRDYEIVQLQSARAKKAGNYHMMIGQNPVTILTIG